MTLPRQNSAWVDGDGRPTRDLYNWARQITIQPQSSASGGSYSLGDLTNVRLSGISDGDVLTWSNTQGRWINSAPSSVGGGYSEGTSFPGSPTTGQKFYRTDLNWLCFYDGARWLTCHEYSISVNQGETNFSTSPAIVARAQIRTDFLPYLTSWSVSTRVVTTNNGSNYWSISVETQDSAATITSISTVTTASIAPNVIVDTNTALNYAVPSSAKTILVRAIKTASPGTLICPGVIYYRLIVT